MCAADLGAKEEKGLGVRRNDHVRGANMQVLGLVLKNATHLSQSEAARWRLDSAIAVIFPGLNESLLC